MKFLFGSLGVGIFAITTAAQAQFMHYSVLDLGPPPGELGATAWDLNNSGDLIANSPGSGSYLYSGGQWTKLPNPDPTRPYTFATGINNLGAVVGGTILPNDARTSLFSYANGTMDLFDVEPTMFQRINDSGQIATTATDRDSAGNFSGGHAVLVSNGTILNLGSLPGKPMSWALGLNGKGDVVGGTGPGLANLNGTGTAFLYSSGTMSNLGVLPAMTWSAAYGINDSGKIVGISGNSSGRFYPFEYENGQMSAMGVYFGFPYNINNRNEVVGFAYVNMNGESTIFVHRDGEAADLRSLIDWPGNFENFGTYADINDLGQIATTLYVNGREHPVILTPDRIAKNPWILGEPHPVPLPSGLLLIFSAVGASGTFVARRSIASRASPSRLV